MKILMIVPILFLSLCKTARATTPPFSSITVSPFYNKGDSKIVVVTKSNNLHFQVFIQNDIYSNLCIVSGTISKAGTFTYTYDNKYSRKNNTVFIRYYTNDSNATVDTEHFSRNLAKGDFAYIEDNESITSDNELVVVSSNGTYSTRKLTYGFVGFDGLYVPSYYHKINLEDYQILITRNDQTYFSCKPTLVIKNYNNIFEDIEGANETATFYLSLKQQRLGFNLELADDLYVNRETLKLSSTPKDGYVKTKHIYFPINDMQNQDKYECYFSFQEFGIDKDFLIHSFEVRALRNIFGDCSNSKYCITRKNL